MKIRVIIAAMVAFLLVPVFSMAQEVILIGNHSVTTSLLSRKEIFKIFMGRKITWDNNIKIVLFFQKDPTVHNAFLKTYIHKSASAFDRLWNRQVFTGKVKLPDYLDGDKQMVEYVSQTKGAIGYVLKDADLDNVKIIRIK